MTVVAGSSRAIAAEWPCGRARKTTSAARVAGVADTSGSSATGDPRSWGCTVATDWPAFAPADTATTSNAG